MVYMTPSPQNIDLVCMFIVYRITRFGERNYGGK